MFLVKENKLNLNILKNKYVIIAMFLLVGILSFAYWWNYARAADCYSSGGGNWSSVISCNSGDHVHIQNGHLVKVDVNDNTVGELTVETGGTLKFTLANRRIDVSGDVTFESGSTFNSNAVGGAILSVGGNLLVDSNVDTSGRAYIYMSGTDSETTISGGGDVPRFFVESGAHVNVVNSFSCNYSASDVLTVNGILDFNATNNEITVAGDAEIGSGADIYGTGSPKINIGRHLTLNNGSGFSNENLEVVMTGSTVDILGSSAVLSNLTVDSSNVLENRNSDLTITNTLAGSSGTLINISGNTLNLKLPDSDLTIGTVDFDASGNYVNYNYAGNQTVIATDYGHLTTDGSGTKTASGNISIANTLTVDAPFTTTGNLTITDTATINSNLTMSGSAYSFNGRVEIGSSGVWTESSAATYNFASDFTNNGTITANTGTHTFSGDIYGYNEISIPNVVIGASKRNYGILTVTNSLSGSSTLTNFDNGVLNLDISDSNFTLTTLDSSTRPLNTVNYNYAGAQTVRAQTYGNLGLGGSGTKTITGVNTINGNLTLEDTDSLGTVAATTGASGTLAVGGNLTVGDDTNLIINTADNLTISGSTDITGELELQSNSTANTFNNLTINSNGIFNNSGNQNITFNGNVVNSSASTVNFGTGNTINFDIGDLSIESTAQDITLSTLNIDGSTFTNLIDTDYSLKVIDITGNSDFLQGTNANLEISGNSAYYGDMFASADGNTITYNGTATTQTIKDGYGTADYYNLELAGTADKQFNNNVSAITVANLIFSSDVDLFNQVSGVQGFTITDSLIGTGSISQSDNANLIFGANFIPSTITLDAGYDGTTDLVGNDNTVTYNGSNQKILPGNYQNLEIDQTNTTDNATLDGNVLIQDNHSLTLSSGKIITDANTLSIFEHYGLVGADSSKYIIGNLAYYVDDMHVYPYALGDPNYYTPVSLDVIDDGDDGYLTITSISGDHPNIYSSTISSVHSLNRYWPLTTDGTLTVNDYDIVFNFNTAELDSSTSATDEGFVGEKWNGSSWDSLTEGTKTETSIEITGGSTFSDFQFGYNTAKVNNVTSSTTNGSYSENDTISIQIVFSDTVTVNTTGGTPTLTLETGSSDAVVDYTSGSGTNTLTFNYTIGSGHVTTDLDYISSSALALNGGTITSGTYNADLTLANPGEAGSLGANKDIEIELFGVSSVTSSVGNGTYYSGSTIPILVEFSQAVDVYEIDGLPQLTLETGDTDAVAEYSSGTGTDTLTFNYVVQVGHSSADLEYLSTTALDLNGALIRDTADTQDADLTLPTLGSADSLGGSKDIVIADISVTNVTSTTSNGTYSVGDPVIPIQVTFSDNITVADTDNAYLTLETGATDATASYASGSGTNTLTFNYTISGRDQSTDLDYVTENALYINGGYISTIPVPGAAGSLGANKAIVIDFFGITNVTSSNADATYTVGDPISIQVTFNKTVTVSGGTPTLTLETGSSDAVADYNSGSGTNTLTFSFNVAAGHTTYDLEYGDINALALNGATIKNGSDDAIIVLMPTHTTGSLGYNKDIVIEVDRFADNFVYLPFDEIQDYQGELTPDLSGYYFDGVFNNYDVSDTKILDPADCVLGGCLNLPNSANPARYINLTQRDGDYIYSNTDNRYLYSIGRYKYDWLTNGATDNPHDFPFSASAWVYIDSGFDEENKNWTIMHNELSDLGVDFSAYIWFVSTDNVSSVGNPEDDELKFWLGDSVVSNSATVGPLNRSRIGVSTVGLDFSENYRNAWHHLAVTYDGTGGDGGASADKIKLYLDGQELSTVADDVSTAGAYVASGNPGSPGGLKIGGGTANFRADGRIDEFRMYDYELLPDEISTLSGYFGTSMSIYKGYDDVEEKFDIETNPNADPHAIVIRYKPTEDIEEYDGFQIKFLSNSPQIKLKGKDTGIHFAKTNITVRQNDRSNPGTCEGGERDGDICYDDFDCPTTLYNQRQYTDCSNICEFEGSEGNYSANYYLDSEDDQQYQTTLQIEVNRPCVEGQRDYDVVIIIQSNDYNKIELPGEIGVYKTEISHWDLGVTEQLLQTTNDFDDPPGSGSGVSQDTLINKITVANNLDFGTGMSVQGTLYNPKFLTYTLTPENCVFSNANYGNLKTCAYTSAVSTNLTNGYTGYVKVDGDFTDGSVVITAVSDGYVTPGSLEHGAATTDSFTGQEIVQLDDKNTSGGVDADDCTAYFNSTDEMPAVELTTAEQKWAEADSPVTDDIETLCHALAISKTLAPSTYTQQVIVTIVGNF